MERTWDGLPVAPERPYACCIVVWRETGAGKEFLLLHRMAPGGAEYEGDWAWTPPSGARQPGEAPGAAAVRELREEIGLTVSPIELRGLSATEDVALYVVEAPADAEIALDAEHDRFIWARLEDAAPKCLPQVVANGLANAAAWLDAQGDRV